MTLDLKMITSILTICGALIGLTAWAYGEHGDLKSEIDKNKLEIAIMSTSVEYIKIKVDRIDAKLDDVRLKKKKKLFIRGMPRAY